MQQPEVKAASKQPEVKAAKQPEVKAASGKSHELQQCIECSSLKVKAASKQPEVKAGKSHELQQCNAAA